MMSDFLTVSEAAGLLRTSPSALYSQRHRSEAPGVLGVRVGRKILWRRSDLDVWFDGQKANADPQVDAANLTDTTVTTRMAFRGQR